MESARENDLNPDVRIGLKMPFTRDRAGLFGQTETTLEQAGHNIKNLLLTSNSRLFGMKSSLGISIGGKTSFDNAANSSS